MGSIKTVETQIEFQIESKAIEEKWYTLAFTYFYISIRPDLLAPSLALPYWNAALKKRLHPSSLQSYHGSNKYINIPRFIRKAIR